MIRALLAQHVADAVATSGVPFLDLAANLTEFAQQLAAACRDDAARLGVSIESVTVQSITLPDELQKLLDQRSGMGMVGPDMARFVQYQAGQSIALMAGGAVETALSEGATASAAPARPLSDAMGLGAGLAMGQLMAQQLQSAVQPPATVRPEDVLTTLERLGELHARGVLTDAEFAGKKAELLRRLG